MTRRVELAMRIGPVTARLVALGIVALSGLAAACTDTPTEHGGGAGGTAGFGSGGGGSGGSSDGGAAGTATPAGAGGAAGGGNGAMGGSGGIAAGAGGDGAGATAGQGADGGVAGQGGMGGESGEGAAGGEPAVTCTGKPGLKRGKSRETVMIDGLERWFNYYAPTTLDPNTPTALVIVPHGYFMDADIMYEVTQYADLADQENFVVAFPSGPGTSIDDPWNIGTPAPECLATVGFLPMTQNDDQAFLDAIIAFAQEDQCIDSNHVFMTGFSMGAYFTNTTGCNRDTIKAIAPHSGGSHDFAGCTVDNKPVLLMHFEADALIPYACGTETRDRWLELNGCESADPEVRMIEGGRCEYYKGCPANGQVAMCTFQMPATGDEFFAAHGWSGGFEPQPVGLSGYAIPETESATQLSWEFFKEFAW